MPKENKCLLCPRKCGVDRENSFGYCKSGSQATVSKVMLHHWEEPCISCKNGSGTIFFSGCSLGCIYCQNQSISRNGKIGDSYSPHQLAELFKKLEEAQADNINLVTPTHYSSQIIEALKIYKPKIPVIYNSSGYEEIESLRALEAYIDIYLIDFKYFDQSLAESYSNAKDYPDVAKIAISECFRQKPNPIITNGKMRSGLIIRHLLLPQATKNAMAVVDWVSNNAKNSYFSLMSQYTPCCDNLPKPLQRKVTAREYDKVVDYILQQGLDKVYLQDFSSANKSFIPDFI